MYFVKILTKSIQNDDDDDYLCQEIGYDCTLESLKAETILELPKQEADLLVGYLKSNFIRTVVQVRFEKCTCINKKKTLH